MFDFAADGRYVNRTEEETEIKVYSNQTKVTLLKKAGDTVPAEMVKKINDQQQIHK